MTATTIMITMTITPPAAAGITIGTVGDKISMLSHADKLFSKLAPDNQNKFL